MNRALQGSQEKPAFFARVPAMEPAPEDYQDYFLISVNATKHEQRESGRLRHLLHDEVDSGAFWKLVRYV
jgi:hypothetical protein